MEKMLEELHMPFKYWEIVTWMMLLTTYGLHGTKSEQRKAMEKLVNYHISYY